MNHEVHHFRGDLIITGDYSELISPSVLSVFFYYPFVTSVSPDNGTRCPFVGLGRTSSLRPIWTGLRINRAWEETATHQTQLFSKDNVWHIHNTLSSSSSIWPFLFFCLRFWPHGPGLGRTSGSPSGRKWRGQRRPALQPWVKRHEQMKVWAWCWWVTLTHYSSKTFCSVTSAILGSAPHPQNKEPESRSQPEPLCQFLFLLNVRLSFQHFSPDLILSHRRGFPLVSVGDDVTPSLWL